MFPVGSKSERIIREVDFVASSLLSLLLPLVDFCRSRKGYLSGTTRSTDYGVSCAYRFLGFPFF